MRRSGELALLSRHAVSHVYLACSAAACWGKPWPEGHSVSGGLHGVGISVVNALSDQLHATVW